MDFVKRVAEQAVADAARSRQKRITRSLLGAVLADQVNLESHIILCFVLLTWNAEQMPNGEEAKDEDHQDDVGK